jgi:hypothetical protein
MPIPGWPGYEASDRGRVRNTLNTRNRPLAVPKILAMTGRNGRPFVTLSRGPERSTKQVGQWVLLAWHGLPPEGKECSHRDGEPWNNQLENLAYETHVENMARKLEHGTIARGSDHGMAKLTERDVEIIRRMAELKIPGMVIAAVFGISVPSVSQIKNGHLWQHVA